MRFNIYVPCLKRRELCNQKNHEYRWYANNRRVHPIAFQTSTLFKTINDKYVLAAQDLAVLIPFDTQHPPRSAYFC